MNRLPFYAAIVSLSFLPLVATANENHQHPSGAASSGGSTLTGCLSGPSSEGTYTLKTGAKEVEVGGLADLKDHIGHKVKLTGTWAKSGAEIGEKESTSTHDSEAAGEKNEHKHFKVTSIQHIAETCTGTAAESSKSTTEGSKPKY